MGTVRIENLPRYTYDDYAKWQGDWELIDGIPYAMTPAPTVEHQRISQKIARYLDESLDHCKHCQALLPVDWKISEDTVVQPDNLVICYQPQGSYLNKAPVVIFEVLSKSTAAKDQSAKFDIYQREGVKYYVMVDPWAQVAKVFKLESGKYSKVVDAENDKLEFDLGPCSIAFNFSRIWE